MIAARAERAAARWRGRVLACLGGIAGLKAEPTADGVAISGRRLRARWLADPRLRNLKGEL